MLSTRTDAELINKTIEKYGKVVKTEELIPIFLTKFGKESAYNRIHVLSKNGWFIRIKQGLYLVNDSITGKFQGELPFLVINQCLFDDSYVSLAHALYYHKLIDQTSDTVTSMSDRINKKFTFQTYTFKITKVKPDLYFGYHTISQQKRAVQIADPEKAILDYLYADINFSTPELFFQPLKEHAESIDLEKLQQYALRFSSNVRRKTGFLLEHLKIPAKQLYTSIKVSRGYTKLSKDSAQFNAKWRVYYDSRLLP